MPVLILKKDIDRFESKFTKGGPDECWVWKAGRYHKTSYGQFRGNNECLAHRFSFLLYRGVIPKGLFVLHTCDNQGCVNPNHLFLGTHQDNMDDKVRKGRQSFDSPGPGEKACKGEQHGMARLTEQDINEIRKRYKRTTYHQSNARELSIEFGVSQLQITRIAKGSRWKHVK